LTNRKASLPLVHHLIHLTHKIKMNLNRIEEELGDIYERLDELYIALKSHDVCDDQESDYPDVAIKLKKLVSDAEDALYLLTEANNNRKYEEERD